MKISIFDFAGRPLEYRFAPLGQLKTAKIGGRRGGDGSRLVVVRWTEVLSTYVY